MDLSADLPPNPQPSNIQRSLRVLIVRIGAMGDVLHAMPAVTALRNLHPDWFLGWAIEPRWSELLQSAHPDRLSDSEQRSPAMPLPAMPLIDVWHQVPTQRWKRNPVALSTLSNISALRRELRGYNYDLCVDLQGSIKSAVIGRLAGAKVFAGPAAPRERQARWLYTKTVETHAAHVIDQACQLLGSAIGQTLQPAPVTLPVDDAAERWCDELLTRLSLRDRRFVFLAPTAGWGAKQWPSERYGAVALALQHAGYQTLVNESLGNQQVDQVIAAATVVPSSLGQMIALLRCASLVIAGDTGPLHLAAALNRPVLALFGPTDPARNGPYATRGIVLRHPSSRLDHSRRTETEAGLRQITTQEVVESALKLLQSTEPHRQGKVKE